MSSVQKHLGLLGHSVEDRITGFSGVVVSIGFDLYGCIQGLVNPGMDAEGKFRELIWFDINRLKRVSESPVMDQPDFVEGRQAGGMKGASEKPVSCKH